MTTLHLRKSIGRSLPPITYHYSLLTVLLLALCWLALSPAPKAFGVSPPPDGGYAGNNTAEGTNALLSLTSGINNTAVGFGALSNDSTGGYNVAVGSNALALNTSGNFNMAIGTEALHNNTANANLAIGFRVLYFNTTGNNLTGVGAGALYNNTIGNSNTAVGAAALSSNTSGDFNTAVGRQALLSNTTGSQNTANGFGALYFNTNGFGNTANGLQALYNNTTGSQNAANGWVALFSNTTGNNNTANGSQALYNNTIGVENTATGFGALYFNTSDDNTATGFQALNSNTTGFQNTANGVQALYFNTIGDFNTAIGFQALENIGTGLNNIAVGYFAGGGHTADDGQNIDIGHSGFAGDNRTTRIGSSTLRAFIAGIRGVTTGNADAVPVVIDSAGQLGTVSSSRRFKKEIKPMDQTSQAILGLQPVTFQYKSDPSGTAQFGLIAEEVAKVDPDLVVRDAQGEIYSVRYEAVNAMLLNEFLKEHRKVQKLEATVAQQQKEFQSALAQQQTEIKALTASLKQQASKIQKVSDQLEVSKPATQMVVNNQ